MQLQQEVAIGERAIGVGNPCCIIAEAGSNHGGQIETALALIDCAAETGADAVKFQTFRTDALVAQTDHPIVRLKDEFRQFGRTVHEMFDKAEMPLEWLPRLREHAASQGLMFLSTPFDEQSADILEEVGIPAFKVASYEIVHLPLLRHIAPLATVARGANLVEKHFTLDTHQYGPDHSFAAGPETLQAMVDGVCEVEREIGNPEKRHQPSEELHYVRGRRSLFAAVDIDKDCVLTREMLMVLRPGVEYWLVQ